MSHNDDDLISVGHILGVHGVRGQVRVFSNTSPRDNILKYSPWVIRHAGMDQVSAVSGRRQGKNVIASLDCINDREHAEVLTGAEILIYRHQLPELSEGEYYWSQLIGLKVVNQDQHDLGTIDQMIETGANDVMVVQGDRERLIPYVMDDVVKSVDLQQQQITVDWEIDY
jgi:16S rRNA processing protein RimM